MIGWILKCWNLLFQFCDLIGFHCLGRPGFSKRTVRVTCIYQNSKWLFVYKDTLLHVYQIFTLVSGIPSGSKLIKMINLQLSSEVFGQTLENLQKSLESDQQSSENCQKCPCIKLHPWLLGDTKFLFLC